MNGPRVGLRHDVIDYLAAGVGSIVILLCGDDDDKLEAANTATCLLEDLEETTLKAIAAMTS